MPFREVNLVCSFVSFRTEMQNSIIYFQIPSRISTLKKKKRLKMVKGVVNATRKARYRLLSGMHAILNCGIHSCHSPWHLPGCNQRHKCRRGMKPQRQLLLSSILMRLYGAHNGSIRVPDFWSQSWRAHQLAEHQESRKQFYSKTEKVCNLQLSKKFLEYQQIMRRNKNIKTG